MQSQSNSLITFDTQLKLALLFQTKVPISLIAFIQVAFTNAKRVLHYHDPTPIHSYEVPPLNWDKHQRALGTEVLTDVLLLAKCDAFLHTESSVAALASYFNPNMKIHFLGDEMGTCEVRTLVILCIIPIFLFHD